ncbi:hypothetical protein PDIG_34590 [Penicillium digitatum PHI26]|uniref:Uncharacterized protein n=2 Tax=Penicillium digitatum TaxID=36651 RepID=K9FYB2_PEND2|nr:hypothetical protein PDIP_54160 [Penicillium digitatum Pd1]EKV11934.1 hypothetical protein PDIP_54160 [Penicillium digitatum Pd1]EKV14079.1 hypothetical protein PDIG_34590 [Penicillium digitatum PHI26]
MDSSTCSSKCRQPQQHNPRTSSGSKDIPAHPAGKKLKLLHVQTAYLATASPFLDTLADKECIVSLSNPFLSGPQYNINSCCLS